MSRRLGELPSVPVKPDDVTRSRVTAPETGGEVVDSPAVWEARATRCLDGLSGPARRLVEIGAVFGASFTAADVAEVQGQPVGGLLAAVQEAVDAGALVLGPSALGFRHDVIRRVAYEALPSAMRLALHRQMGELLVQRRDWAEAANHLMQGVAVGDRVAAAGLDQVAREIRTTTPEWASELALRALELTDVDDVDRFARAATAVKNLVTAGRLGEANYLARRVPWDRTVCHPRPRQICGSRSPSCRCSPADHRRPSTRSSLSRRHPVVPGPLHAPAELCLLWARVALDDRAGAGAQVEAILSGGAGRDEILPVALAALGVITWRDGLVADSLALARAAVLRGDRQPPGIGGPFGRLCLASMLTALGDLEEARHLIEATRDEITAGGETLWSAAPAVAAAQVGLAAGRVDDASASAHAAIDLATELGTSCFLSPARTVLAELAMMRGEMSEAAGAPRARPPGHGLATVERKRPAAGRDPVGRGRVWSRRGAGAGSRPLRRRGRGRPPAARRSVRGGLARADRARRRVTGIGPSACLRRPSISRRSTPRSPPSWPRLDTHAGWSTPILRWCSRQARTIATSGPRPLPGRMPA